MENDKLTKFNECYYCVHSYKIPGNTHIGCANPDENMEGDSHGIKNGWFFTQ